jgi:NTE family protein
MSATKKERTALVFAGGGSLDAAQVGMLEALAEAGVAPDFLVGASVGAIKAKKIKVWSLGKEAPPFFISERLAVWSKK